MGDAIFTRRFSPIETFTPIEATGGSISNVNIGGIDYRIHAFTSVGTSTFIVTNKGTDGLVEYLVIAGGGGGGAGWRGAGGGAGGYRTNVVGDLSGSSSTAEAPLIVSAGSYGVTVGSGGAGRSSNSGLNGGISMFGDIISDGGGGGGGPGNSTTPGVGGGSGGGGNGNWTASTFSPAGSGLSLQGTNGGRGAWDGFGEGQCGGGGGGAGQAGFNGGNSGTLGDGGAGLSSNITGTPTFRGGGGSGGNYGSGNTTTGGVGGGGTGSRTNDGTVGQVGQPNTGGGGGGTGGGDNVIGGAGGSGIVIIRYPLVKVD